jgi:hypothetical protein
VREKNLPVTKGGRFDKLGMHCSASRKKLRRFGNIGKEKNELEMHDWQV